MKYQVREGRNRVIILALCALSLLVFILAVRNVVNPDVLIEVSIKLQARQQAMQQQVYVQSALKTHRLLMQLDDVPVKGPANSKIIVTEFFDYECIACSMMAPVMEKVMSANAGVRFAFRD